jgi:hypothetical protein
MFIPYVENHKFSKRIPSFLGVELNALDSASFSEIMTRFLFSPTGSRFRFLFRYDTPLVCGKPAPNLTVSLSLVTFDAKIDPKMPSF